MPVETLRPTDGRLAGGPFTSAMPFRILNKGPDYFRRAPETGTRKLSAVERLEADKAKYVKSQQVALNKQEPVKPPIIRKPLLSPSMIMQCRLNTPPARKITRRLADVENGGPEHGMCRGPQLNLDILNNLINVCDGPLASSPTASSPSPSASSPSSGGHSIGSGQSAEPQHCINFKAHLLSTPTSSRTSSPLNSQTVSKEPSRRPPPVPARAPRPVPQGSYGPPNSVTVRRVDVRPQAEIIKPQRLPLQPKPRQPQAAQPQIAQPQAPPPAQQQPVSAHPPSPCLPPSPLLLRSGVLPPASPAFTRLSASSRGSRPGSARKYPTLHRSKSDLSDRYSRATADLERFFNYCGLNPEVVEGMGGVECFARANSDIVSVSKLRSVSTPSSECGDGRRGEEDDDDDDDGPIKPNERVPYGISVIERNARVIKWLYGIRQARDASQNISNV